MFTNKTLIFKIAATVLPALPLLHGCIERINNEIDLAGPLFSFTITNLSNTQLIDKDDAIIEAKAGDEIELKVVAINYNANADNTIELSIFDINDTYRNKQEVEVNVVIPNVESGKYPVTATFTRDVESTKNHQYAGIRTNQRTMYISIK